MLTHVVCWVYNFALKFLVCYFLVIVTLVLANKFDLICFLFCCFDILVFAYVINDLTRYVSDVFTGVKDKGATKTIKTGKDIVCGEGRPSLQG